MLKANVWLHGSLDVDEYLLGLAFGIVIGVLADCILLRKTYDIAEHTAIGLLGRLIDAGKESNMDPYALGSESIKILNELGIERCGCPDCKKEESE